MMKKLLILFLSLSLLLLCASAASADFLSVGMSLSKTSFSAAGEKVTVTVKITSSGEGDLEGVSLYYPSGKQVSEFGTKDIDLGATETWRGTWSVTQKELDAGKITFRVKYAVYDDEGNRVTKSRSVSKKITVEAAAATPTATPLPTATPVPAPTAVPNASIQSELLELVSSNGIEVVTDDGFNGYRFRELHNVSGAPVTVESAFIGIDGEGWTVDDSSVRLVPSVIPADGTGWLIAKCELSAADPDADSPSMQVLVTYQTTDETPDVLSWDGTLSTVPVNLNGNEVNTYRVTVNAAGIGALTDPEAVLALYTEDGRLFAAADVTGQLTGEEKLTLTLDGETAEDLAEGSGKPVRAVLTAEGK